MQRDGTVFAMVPGRSTQFPVPAERRDYRLIYHQTGASPYPHDRTTTWSFRSAGDPGAGIGSSRIGVIAS